MGAREQAGSEGSEIGVRGVSWEQGEQGEQAICYVLGPHHLSP